MTSVAGQDLILECEYRLSGAQATWYYQGKKISNGGRYSISVKGTVHRLVVKGALTADSGEYRLEIGKIKTAGYITVVGRLYTCIEKHIKCRVLSVWDRFPSNMSRLGFFNNALNTFYLRLYGVGHMVKVHSDSESGNPLPPHGLFFPIKYI